MIKCLATSLTEFIVKEGVIDEKDNKMIAICHYGIEVFIASIVNILLIIILGLFTNTVFDSIIFLSVFIPIRQCTGGYHAESYSMCNFVLAVTYIFVLLGMYLAPNENVVKVFVWILSFIIVILFAPCENKHKKISRKKKRIFKLISCSIWSVLGLVLILFPKVLDKIQMNVLFTMGVISMLIVLDIISKKGGCKK